MSVLLPLVRIKVTGAPRPILFSGNQEGVFGGEDLPIPRMGDRFAVDFATDQLQRGAASRELIAALTEATTAGAIAPLSLVNASRAYAPGGVIDGGGQAGSTLVVRGRVPGETLARGDFFSIVHLGRRYVHMIRANTGVGGDGRAAIPIWPMLRFITLDGAQCEFAQPYIEGRLVGFDPKGAVFSRIRVEPLTFTILERA